MKQRTVWAAVLVFAACIVTFTCIRCDADAKDSSDVSSVIRHQTHVSAGGIHPPGVALENPYQNDKQSVETGERLFSSMNCDGCHGGGALGWIGPSLVDGRWRYGGADGEVFHSIFYGRPKGMPAYGGVLGSEGIWMIVTYLKSQPVPNVVPTTSYEDLATNAAAIAKVSTPPIALQHVLPATRVEGMLAKYGCVACHAVQRKLVGPSYKDIASKYRARTGAAAYLVMQVKNGGEGVWGTIPMPSNADVPSADLDTIIAWILKSK